MWNCDRIPKIVISNHVNLHGRTWLSVCWGWASQEYNSLPQCDLNCISSSPIWIVSHSMKPWMDLEKELYWYWCYYAQWYVICNKTWTLSPCWKVGSVFASWPMGIVNFVDNPEVVSHVQYLDRTLGKFAPIYGPRLKSWSTVLVSWSQTHRQSSPTGNRPPLGLRVVTDRQMLPSELSPSFAVDKKVKRGVDKTKVHWEARS